MAKKPHITCEDCGATFPQTAMYWHHSGTFHRSGRPGMLPDDPRLYEAAMETCHEMGIPWTDPRTGFTHQPPEKP